MVIIVIINLISIIVAIVIITTINLIVIFTITIEFMFAGINIFWARLRLILARAAR